MLDLLANEVTRQSVVGTIFQLTFIYVLRTVGGCWSECARHKNSYTMEVTHVIHVKHRTPFQNQMSQFIQFYVNLSLSYKFSKHKSQYSHRR